MNRIPAPADMATAIAALETGAIISPLTAHGLLRFSGEDTLTFLHGQFSSDIKALDEQHAQYSSYSTAKGRMLASFLVFRAAGDYWLQMSADILPAIQKRLSMYILRSKTKAVDASQDYAMIGIAGSQAAQIARTIVPQQPTQALTVQHEGALTLISLPEGRYQIVVPAEQTADTWAKLAAAGAIPADESIWRLSEIRAGIPWVTAPTQEAFVPQMANLDLLGGVSFTKGCYTGQEIVARTQHLGKIKRRMFRARIAAESVAAGQEVFSPEMNGQHSGQILLAAPATPGSTEALVVAQISSIEHGLHLGSLEGPQLQMLDLPYSIE
ncbi:hypothetical protein SAMN05660284_01174 [Formivibrio citricus]|uniref:GCVT N-terminal domain-containing protein n=1 Tax=Formivibrio citricus TaxID=83765 RepID=A0A1I4XZ82_9NEIS|nr:folate-binding protein YgfZ [Formivibrio citricus]SFN30713.1 hypothetical protein SAMN05660284_01174 [Formivibrio citricus]